MPRKPPKGKSLAEVKPDLTEEWHTTKNGALSPYDVSYGSAKKVWWKCPKGKDHEWVSSLNNRSKGQGCPVCSGQKTVLSNCLATTNPELSEEWHPTKNGSLNPYDVTSGKSKKVWWKCPEGDDHEWEALISNRSKGQNCPICCNKKTVLSNCLATTNPKLSEEWHPTKNGSLTPYDVVSQSNKKVWWKCSKGEDHQWRVSVAHRANGRNCPICSGRKTAISNSLATLNPKLAKEWHPTKNLSLKPTQYTVSSHKKVWWKCPEGDDHEWEAIISSRSRGSGCPICDGKKVILSNSLATTNPELSKEWHPTKNGDVTPYDVTINNGKRFWWKCPKGDDHVWRTSVDNRTNGKGCPVCSGNKVVLSNCLATTNPELVSQWHPTKNGNLSPHKVTYGSGKKIWWICDKSDDHVWRTATSDRIRGRGCPYCTLTPQSKQELTITFELRQFFEINPRGFKTRVKGKLWSIDIYVPSLNLGIEFDGNYWHKDKRQLDKLKTEKLKEDGFQIMRVREEPLKPITEIDVISTVPFNAKKVTDDILSHILSYYALNPSVSSKIEGYMAKDVIQNEKALDKYIEKILMEKASRK